MYKGDISNYSGQEVILSFSGLLMEDYSNRIFRAPEIRLKDRIITTLNTMQRRSSYSFTVAVIEWSAAFKVAEKLLDDADLFYSKVRYFETFGELFNYCKKNQVFVVTDNETEHAMLHPAALSWAEFSRR